ncbi:MAG: hypothetical protein ACKVH8_12165 [Pirellulales bacterium]
MGHTSFKHRQTSSTGQFPTGGKVAVFIKSKRANCRLDRGQIIDLYLILVKSKASRIPTCPKSFETGSYSNTKTGATTAQPMKTVSKT